MDRGARFLGKGVVEEDGTHNFRGEKGFLRRRGAAFYVFWGGNHSLKRWRLKGQITRFLSKKRITNSAGIIKSNEPLCTVKPMS